MSKVYRLPRWIVEDTYRMVLGHGSVTRNMSIHNPDSDDPGFTGGSPQIVAIHKDYEDYVSLQEYVRIVQEGVPKSEGHDEADLLPLDDVY